MGSGASSLPDKLNEDDLKTVCGEEYDPAIYTSLEKEGVVDRNKFLSISSNGEEREVFTLYRSYATSDGKITQGSFIDLCRDTKLLHKSSQFSLSQSSSTFEDNAGDTQTSDSAKTVNYESFRFEILPVVADKKGMSLQDLVQKLSRVDVDDSRAAVPETCESPSTKAQADAQLALLMNDEEEESENSKLLVMWEAAIKLQRLERVRIAKRRRQYLAEVKRSRECVAPQRDFDIPVDPESPSELSLQALFARHSRRREMGVTMLLELCRDRQLYSKTFTKMDGRLVFEKSVAMALSSQSGDEYSDGVYFGKRISYKVFREIVVPCLAELIGTTRSKLIDKLVQ